jgi:hypothetical protein
MLDRVPHQLRAARDLQTLHNGIFMSRNGSKGNVQ